MGDKRKKTAIGATEKKVLAELGTEQLFRFPSSD